MSSEDSGDENTTLYRRPLPWMKSKYSNSMKLLDRIYYNGLSAKSKGMVRNREDGETSERPLPKKVLDFKEMLYFVFPDFKILMKKWLISDRKVRKYQFSCLLKYLSYARKCGISISFPVIFSYGNWCCLSSVK